MIIRVFLGLLLVIFFILALLHVPPIQKKVANFAASQLIKKSGGHITLNNATFDIYQGVVLDRIILTDLNSDTLMTINKVNISPKSTLLSLVSRLRFNDLNVEGLSINILRKYGDQNSNWQQFLASLENDDKKTGEPTNLFFSHFELFNVNVSLIDEPNGIEALGTIEGLEVEIKDVDSTQFWVKRMAAIRPQLVLQKCPSEYGRNAQPATPTQTDSIKTVVLPSFRIDEFSVLDAHFSGQLNDERKTQTLELTDFTVLLSDVVFNQIDDWSLSVNDISGINEAYNLKHLGINQIKRRSTDLIIDHAFLRIDDTFLDFTAVIQDLPQLDQIGDASAMIEMRQSKLKLSDLFPIIPSLEVKLQQEPMAMKYVELSGLYKLSKDEISGNAINLWLNGKHHFEGNGVFNPKSIFSESLLNVRIKKFTSDLVQLDQDIAAVTVPEELLRLGKVDFSGNFDGFLNDFVAQGLLKSELGTANVDIQFDLNRSHKDSIAYAGFLSLEQFDLSRMLNNEDFGMVSTSLNIERGIGTSIANSSALLEATIQQFDFKGYSYNDAIFDGQLSSKVIDGHFEIKDKSLDFSFDGLVDFSQEEPIYNFKIDAENIDFCQLNIAEFPCQLSFDAVINVKGSSLKNIEGLTSLNDITIQQDTSPIHFDNITISSQRKGADRMLFEMSSDYAYAEIEGNFNLLKMYQSIVRQVTENHQDHVSLTSYKDNFGELSGQSFSYNINLKRANAIFEFLKVNLDLADNTALKGEYRHEKDHFDLSLSSSAVSYAGIEGRGLTMQLVSDPYKGLLDMRFDQLTRDNIVLEHAYIKSRIEDEELSMLVDVRVNENNRVELESRSIIQKSGYFTEFIYDDIVIDSSVWTILPNPGLGLYPKELDIQNFVVTDGNRSIGLKDINRKGLDISLNKFNFEVINPFINYDKLYFTGYADAQVRIEDIFEKKGIQGYLEVPDFAINDEPFGTLLVRAKRQSEQLIDLDLSITKGEQNLYTRGYFDTEKNYVNVDLTIQEYPMDFFEYIITDGISETVGTTNIEAKIYGTIDNIDNLTLSGKAIVKNAGVRIDYIGAFYRIDQEEIGISEKFIDLNGVNLIDERNNSARITGGLRHNFLADFRADVEISSPQFIALNTTKEDNPIYYGTGMGPIDVSFKGPFDAIDMRVTATAGEFSTLFIPITSTQYGYDESFINFDYRNEHIDSSSANKLVERLKTSGVDFEMNLSFEREAEVQVIYDEETSNVLIGHGEGDLRLKVKRDGEFTVFGQYNVESGEYLYTSFGFIAKPFVINQGGTVTWTGDPINATLNISAYYPGLRAPLNVFLQEYIDASGLSESEFKQRRNVDLNLLLTENLFNPAINFDISFPDLVGELKTLANAKVRTLQSTENGINNQVVGLIVFRNFLPDNNPFANLQASSLGQAGNNTITEFLTSQLSLLFSDYLSEKLEGDIISGIDFEIALAQNGALQNAPGTTNLLDGFIDFVPDEVQLNLRNEFKNDNFVLNIGGNYVRENPLNTASNYLTGDFSLDWYITEDKRLKLRFYGIYDYDETAVARRQIYGFGINYRREFGKLTEQTFESLLENLIEEIQDSVQNKPSDQ